LRIREYHKPTSLAEAYRLKAGLPDALYIAGGVDLMVQIRAGIDRPPALISLRNIGGLKAIKPGKITRIGSMTTISEILHHPKLGKAFPVLLDAARSFGSMQIRNLATIGGNLCNASPCADMPPALLVLDAGVCLEGPSGRREMSLEDFFLGPKETCIASDEVLTSIVLKKPSPDAKAAYLRNGRVRMDLARVSVAVLLEMDGNHCKRARVAAGAVAPVPLRLRGVEEILEGQTVESDLLKRARETAEGEVSPITDVRTSAEYRKHMTGVLFQRAVESILDGRNNGR
jgi:carbon-monoxide dehydrogenase medium subunit